eukprot:scaffold935_cov334-Prasinococcus_capsulatus_cf.AAC.5
MSTPLRSAVSRRHAQTCRRPRVHKRAARAGRCAQRAWPEERLEGVEDRLGGDAARGAGRGGHARVRARRAQRAHPHQHPCPPDLRGGSHRQGTEAALLAHHALDELYARTCASLARSRPASNLSSYAAGHVDMRSLHASVDHACEQML